MTTSYVFSLLELYNGSGHLAWCSCFPLTQRDHEPAHHANVPSKCTLCNFVSSSVEWCTMGRFWSCPPVMLRFRNSKAPFRYDSLASHSCLLNLPSCLNLEPCSRPHRSLLSSFWSLVLPRTLLSFEKLPYHCPSPDTSTSLARRTSSQRIRLAQNTGFLSAKQVPRSQTRQEVSV
jgi:hypothetical protein